METKIDVKKEQKEKVLTPGKIVWNNFKKNKFAIVGLFIIVFIVLFAVVGPFMTGYGENGIDYAAMKGAPNIHHLLGTDDLGRDVLTRLMYGGRISIAVGVFSVIIEVILGALLGVISGYYGGIMDSIIMRVVDIFLCIPFLPILIVLGAMMSDFHVSPGARIIWLMFIIAFLSWPSLCRLVRGEVLSLREQEYMQAAEALGIKDTRKMFKHLLPNTLPTIIVTATLGVGSNILTESALSFLGLGVIAPTASWGNMIQVVNNLYTLQHYPWLWIPPGVCIFLTAMSINVVGDALRDALDPKLRR
ncbi:MULTISPECIES: oligopeptide ABC transporter permease [Clostridium]|uniref:oligopeptide ABC transporter permease n=1 Tax=Clostridium TaxID=1485 RepID=UPI00069F70A4|nr:MULTISPECIES: oligopeptide ABC transporter permease [Clostridium]KOF55993.1 peptide ABC transporter permease [Clostridium sp. DMHC 10]MCD2345409.1 ABC transporter permease [Clostridium guangxiense]